MIRFDAQPPLACGFVDSRYAPAHKLHKPKNNKPKRTIDVLPKPDNFKSYRHMSFFGLLTPGRDMLRSGFYFAAPRKYILKELTR